MKIVIIEDDPNKVEQLCKLLDERFSDASVAVARSFQSGLSELIAGHADVVLLDMQLPTFDKTPTEDGGRRRSFAGRELLRQIARRKLVTAAIIVTQLQKFEEGGESLSLAELEADLIAMKIPNYRGLVYYHPKLVDWKDTLTGLIENAFKKR